MILIKQKKFDIINKMKEVNNMSSFEDLQLPTEEITQQVKINDTLILEVRK
jgi:hypothetical protein